MLQSQDEWELFFQLVPGGNKCVVVEGILETIFNASS